jgi:hypothetical protein
VSLRACHLSCVVRKAPAPATTRPPLRLSDTLGAQKQHNVAAWVVLVWGTRPRAQSRVSCQLSCCTVVSSSQVSQSRAASSRSRRRLQRAALRAGATSCASWCCCARCCSQRWRAARSSAPRKLRTRWRAAGLARRRAAYSSFTFRQTGTVMRWLAVAMVAWCCVAACSAHRCDVAHTAMSAWRGCTATSDGDAAATSHVLSGCWQHALHGSASGGVCAWRRALTL